MSATELIAAAQVAVSAPSISLTTSSGISTATRSSVGVYVLELKEDHHTDHWIATATLLGAVAGQIAVDPIDKTHVQVSTFDGGGAAADSSFFLQILRLGDC